MEEWQMVTGVFLVYLIIVIIYNRNKNAEEDTISRNIPQLRLDNEHIVPQIVADEGYTIVSIKEFTSKYKDVILCVPPQIRDAITASMIKGQDLIQISTDTLNEIEKRANMHRAEEQRLQICVIRNNNGIELERGGKIDEAIKVYEENIADGYPTMHSYTRLMIIYRRLKDYDNEQRVIHRAIEVYEKAGLATDDVGKWKLRMEKSKLLQSKQTNKNYEL